MPRDLGYKHVWENCYHSTYGREKAEEFGVEIYCITGESFYRHNNQRVTAAPKCHDWHKCRGLDRVIRKSR